ncbi:UNVERIFIED_CONTAM: hypothetical protein RMT77_014451 [Armadillidium vulgare]
MNLANFSNEKMLILDLIDDGPTIKLLGQLQIAESSQCIKERVVQICRASHPLMKLPITQINIGTIAVVHTNIHSTQFFHRIQIIDNRNWSSGSLKVHLIDECLWNRDVSLSCLYVAPQSLLEIPKCSEIFYLADVSPLCHNTWSGSCIKALRDQLLQKLVTGTVFRENGKVSVFRPYEPGDQGQLLAETMFQCGMAHITPSFPGLSPLSSCNSHFIAGELTNRPFVPGEPTQSPFIANEYSKNSFLYGPERHISPLVPSQSCPFPSVPITTFQCMQETNAPALCQNKRNFVTMDNMSTAPYNTTEEEKEECHRFISTRIKEGFSDSCQVSCIEGGPRKFAIKLFSNQHLEKKLKEKLDNICLPSLKSLSVVELGKCVLCTFNQKLWRGIVVGIDEYLQGSLNVYLVDLGSEEKIPVSSVWKIPKDFLDIPILVERCRLDGLPKSHSTQMVKNFRNLVEKQVMKVTFCSRTTDLLFNVNLFLENYSIAKLISLNIYAREKLNSGDEVIVSYISENSSLVYVQLSKNLSKIMEIQREIAVEGGRAHVGQNRFHGCPCIALYSEDSNYYRGLMTDSLYEGVTVLYVDFGNEEEHTKLENIKEIPLSLLNKIPSQAIPCILDEVEDLKIGSSDVFDLENKTYIVSVIDEVNKTISGIPTPVFKVKLVDKITQRCLNDDIAQRFNLKRDRNPRKQTVHFSEQVSVFPTPVVDEEHERERLMDKRFRSNEIPIFPDILKVCKVTFVVSPLLFFVTLVQNEENIKVINRILKSDFNLASKLQCPSTVGDEVMMASSKEKDCYFRAVIVSHLQKDLLNLRLVDFGKEIAVSKNQVRRLSPDISLVRYPPQAIKCALEDPSLVSDIQGKSFEATITREAVKIHFIRKEGDTWMVSLLKTIDLLRDSSGTNLCDSKSFPQRKSSFEDRKEASRSDQCRNWRERSMENGEGHKNVSSSLSSSNHLWRSDLDKTSPRDRSPKRANNASEGVWKPECKSSVTTASPDSSSSANQSKWEDEVDSCKTSPIVDSKSSSANEFERLKRESLEIKEILEQPPLLSGECVFVSSHDETLKEVWVQRKEDTDIIDDLAAKIESLVQDDKNEADINELSKGHICLAQSLIDDVWYRARILSMEKWRMENDVIKVHFVDYGNEEELSAAKIRPLPHSFLEPHTLAYLCIPRNSDFSSIVDSVDEEMVVEVLSREKNRYEVMLNVKGLTAAGHEEDILNDDQEDPNEVVVEVPKQNLEFVKPPLGVELKVFISFVDNDGSLHLQLGSNSELIDNIMELLESSVKGGETLKTIEEGLICCGKYSVDDQWYRAKVLSFDPELRTCVAQFLDYGNSETVDFDDLKPLPPDCWSLSAQAIHCFLFSDYQQCILKGEIVKKTLEAFIEQEITGYFEMEKAGFLLLRRAANNGDLLEDKVLTQETCEITNENDSSLNVELLKYDEDNHVSQNEDDERRREHNIKKEATLFSNRDDDSINEKNHANINDDEKFNDSRLQNQKIEFESLLSDGKDDNLSQKSVKLNQCSMTYESFQQQEADEMSQSFEGFQNVAAYVSSSEKENEESQKLTDKSLLITYVENEGENVWVQDLAEASLLDTLINEIDQYVRTEGEIMVNPEVNDICICKFSQDEGYYRAKVLSIENDSALVHYVDFGNSDLVAVDILYKIPEKYLTLPHQAIHCKVDAAKNCDKACMSVIANHAASADVLTGRLEENEDEKTLVNVFVNGEALETVKSKLLNKDNIQNVFENTEKDNIQNMVIEREDVEVMREHDAPHGDEIDVKEAGRDNEIDISDGDGIPVLDVDVEVVVKNNEINLASADEIPLSEVEVEKVERDNEIDIADGDEIPVSEANDEANKDSEINIADNSEIHVSEVEEVDSGNEIDITDGGEITVSKVDVEEAEKDSEIDSADNNEIPVSEVEVGDNEIDIADGDEIPVSEVDVEEMDKDIEINIGDNNETPVSEIEVGTENEINIAADNEIPVSEVKEVDRENEIDITDGDEITVSEVDVEEAEKDSEINIADDNEFPISEVEEGDRENEIDIVDGDKTPVSEVVEEMDKDIEINIGDNEIPVSEIEVGKENEINIATDNEITLTEVEEIDRGNEVDIVDEGEFPVSEVEVEKVDRDNEIKIFEVDKMKVEQFAHSLAQEVLDHITDPIFSSIYIDNKSEDQVILSLQRQASVEDHGFISESSSSFEEAHETLSLVEAFEKSNLTETRDEALNSTNENIVVEAEEFFSEELIINIDDKHFDDRTDANRIEGNADLNSKIDSNVDEKDSYTCEVKGSDSDEHSSENELFHMSKYREESSECCFSSCDENNPLMRSLLDEDSYFSDESDGNVREEEGGKDRQQKALRTKSLPSLNELERKKKSGECDFLDFVKAKEEKNDKDLQLENEGNRSFKREDYNDNCKDSLQVCKEMDNKKESFPQDEIRKTNEESNVCSDNVEQGNEGDILIHIEYVDEYSLKICNKHENQVSSQEYIEGYTDSQQADKESRNLEEVNSVFVANESGKIWTSTSRDEFFVLQLNSPAVCSPLSSDCENNGIENDSNEFTKYFTDENLTEDFFICEPFDHKDEVSDSDPNSEREENILDFKNKEPIQECVLSPEEREFTAGILKKSTIGYYELHGSLENVHKNRQIFENAQIDKVYDDRDYKNTPEVETSFRPTTDTSNDKCLVSTPVRKISNEDNIVFTFDIKTGIENEAKGSLDLSGLSDDNGERFEYEIPTLKDDEPESEENCGKVTPKSDTTMINFNQSKSCEEAANELKNIPSLASKCKSVLLSSQKNNERFLEFENDNCKVCQPNEEKPSAEVIGVEDTFSSLHVEWDESRSRNPETDFEDFTFQMEFEKQNRSEDFPVHSEEKEETKTKEKVFDYDCGEKGSVGQEYCGEVNKCSEDSSLPVAETFSKDNSKINKMDIIPNPAINTNEDNLVNKEEPIDDTLNETMDDFIVNVGLEEQNNSYKMHGLINDSESYLASLSMANLSSYSNERNAIAIVGRESVRYSLNRKPFHSDSKEIHKPIIEEMLPVCGSKRLLYSESEEPVGCDVDLDDDNSKLIDIAKENPELVAEIDFPEIKENVYYGKISNVSCDSSVYIWIQSAEDFPLLQMMEEELKNMILETLPSPVKAQVGQVYASYFCGDLHRSKVLSVKEDYITVLFIDTGKLCDISLGNVFECPHFINEIPALAKQYNLAVNIPKENSGKATTILLERCCNQTCAFIDVTLFLRSRFTKNRYPFALVASENVGSVTDFLVERNIAEDLSRVDVSYLEVMKELNKINISKLKDLKI